MSNFSFLENEWKSLFKNATTAEKTINSDPSTSAIKSRVCVEETVHRIFEKTSETKYSIYRHQQSQDKRVWHIHGEQAMKSSILLGFQHYVDYSSYVRDRANHFMKTAREKKFFDQKPSWVDFFFTHEVNIVGLGMKFSEYPLWWLLAYRNSRMQKGGPVNINNNINYIGLASSLRENPNLTDALESYGVKVCPVDTDDYDLLYKLVLTNKWKNHLTT